MLLSRALWRNLNNSVCLYQIFSSEGKVLRISSPVAFSSWTEQVMHSNTQPLPAWLWGQWVSQDWQVWVWFFKWTPWGLDALKPLPLLWEMASIFPMILKTITDLYVWLYTSICITVRAASLSQNIPVFYSCVVPSGSSIDSLDTAYLDKPWHLSGSLSLVLPMSLWTLVGMGCAKWGIRYSTFLKKNVSQVLWFTCVSLALGSFG